MGIPKIVANVGATAMVLPLSYLKNKRSQNQSPNLNTRSWKNESSLRGATMDVLSSLSVNDPILNLTGGAQVPPPKDAQPSS
ncbi:unnamed protein product [Rhizoctonia solani]|uniref:Uncharacterized protein n=1 Tax=Rhizoctonia solani TaxID=456999 RepID=A0A8H3AV69_9AGAM|nr:unnamed protein product [Rhizoctonia solani]